jgi:hypothetical protein
MSKKVKLARLRADYGESAVKAYRAIGELLLSTGDMTTVMLGLHRLFEQYGLEATGAALRLHAQRTREMIDLVHHERPKSKRS